MRCDRYYRAWSIFTEISPPNDPLPHSYGLTLAEIYFVAGRYQDGIKILDMVEAACRDREIDSYVRCKYLRGWAELLRGDYAAAMTSLRIAVDLAEDHLDKKHAYALLSRFHLARCLDLLGQYEASQPLFKRLLPLTRERVALPHARQMELFTHAWALLHCGATDEQTLQEALDTAERD